MKGTSLLLFSRLLQTVFLKFCCLVLALALPQSAHAAIFVVNRAADAVDARPGDGVCATRKGGCTLRAAIQESNALAGRDVINLPPGTYKLSIRGGNEEGAATGDLDINSNLSIRGSGAAETVIDGDRIDRVLDVAPRLLKRNIDVTISGVTVRRGEAFDGFGGGGIRSTSHLTVMDSVITDNRIPNILSDGGAGLAGRTRLRFDREDDPRFTLRDIVVSDNTIAGPFGGGGGIDASESALTITRGVISGNSAGFFGFGGGINAGQTITLTDVTISHNTADSGGGLSGNVIMNRCTVSGNTATGNAPGSGGGMLVRGRVTNSTISGNTVVRGSGGGISNNDQLILTNVTLVDNSVTTPVFDDGGGGILQFGSTASTTLRNAIIANNVPSNCNSPLNPIISEGNNLASDDTCNLTDPADLPGTNPLLDPLDDNGGPTKTHALQSGSPALDAGDNAVCPATDQRGFRRPVDGEFNGIRTCDIGAFESLASAPVCHGRNATIVGTGERDVLVGTPRADVMHSLGGDDVVRGLSGNDRICGGNGRDDLFGQGGDDELDGGRGFDLCIGGSGIDTPSRCERVRQVP
jgi:CSLREA domain-containing protein